MQKNIGLFIIGFFLLLILLFLMGKESRFIKSDKVELPKKESIKKAILSSVKLETNKLILEGRFKKPNYCPKSENVALNSLESNGIFLYNISNGFSPKLLTKSPTVGGRISWSKNCDFIYFKTKNNKYQVSLNSLNIATGEIKSMLNVNPEVVLTSQLDIQDTLICLNQKTLEIYAEYKGKRWDIITSKGNYYQVIPSPNSKYIIVHNGAFIELFDSNGTKLNDFGRGLATSWSSNSQYILGFLDESTDGKQITSSDLFMLDIKTGKRYQLTTTAKIQEVWPSWKPNEEEIIYSDQVTGNVYTSKINLKY